VGVCRILVGIIEEEIYQLQESLDRLEEINAHFSLALW
jgi:hypothetical protein